jgi:predicted secreted protein
MALAVAAVLALAVIASTAAARTESKFSLVEVQKSSRRVGNHFVNHGVLFVPGTSTVAGTDRVKFSRKGNVHAVARFPDGKIKAQGNVDASRIVVVGGSGRWNGAAGKIKIHQLSRRKTLLSFAIVQ